MMQDKSVEFEVLKDKFNNAVGNTNGSESIKKSERPVKAGTLQNLDRYLNRLSKYQKITVDPVVLTKKKGLFGKLVILFKRFCRKIVAWYLQPVCDDQTKYNEQVYLAMLQIAAQLEENRKQQDELKQMILEQNEKIEREINAIKNGLPD